VFGFIRERTGNIMPGITPSNTHTSRDGTHLIIGANGDAIFKRLMNAVGRTDLACDTSLSDNAGRDQRRDELYQAIDAWVSQHDAQSVLETLQKADVPVSPIYSVADMFADPQFSERNMIERHSLPDGRMLAVPGIVPKLSESPGSTEWLGPALGAHTDEVLLGLGLTQEKIKHLKNIGAV
jgi:formyl-CoA transferase